MNTFYKCALIVLIAVSCSNNEKSVEFYISNGSLDMPRIFMNIYVDDSLRFQDSILYTKLTPDYTKVNLDNVMMGKHSIRFVVVMPKDTFEEVYTVNVDHDKYITVTFNYKIKGKYEYETERAKFDLEYPSEKYPNKVFEFDSIAIKPDLNLKVRNEVVVIE